MAEPLPLVGYCTLRFSCGHTTEEFVEHNEHVRKFEVADRAENTYIGHIGILETDCPDCHKEKKTCNETPAKDPIESGPSETTSSSPSSSPSPTL